MRKILFQPHQKCKIFLLLGDIVIITLTFLTIRNIFNLFDYHNKEHSSFQISLYFIIASCLVLLTFYVLGLYEQSRANHPKSLILSIICTFAAVFLIYSALAYIFVFLRPGKILMFLSLAVACVLNGVWHIFFFKWFKMEPQRLLFIGDNKIIREMISIVTTQFSEYYTIGGHWHRTSHNPTLPDLSTYVTENDINTIVYSVHSEILHKLAPSLIKLRFIRNNIYDAHKFYQMVTNMFPIHYIDDFWMLIKSQKDIFFPGVTSKLKRALDILLVICSLPIALPIIGLAAILIKLESKGPVFFIQERLGMNEKPFKLIKLRTMIDEAEKLTGPQWCRDNDCRITRVGKILRKLRLDELPQIFNILKGDMSIVGPRPIRKYFTDQLAEQIPYYRLRLLVKPGLTGWAQVCYGHANTVADHAQMAKHDLFYLVNQSFLLDFYIILKTLKVIFWGKGR